MIKEKELNFSAGTILVPKKEREHHFKKGQQYVVTEQDMQMEGVEIGEYWEIKKGQ